MTTTAPFVSPAFATMPPRPASDAGGKVEWRTYHSLVELQANLRALDRPHRDGLVTIVLGLDETFCGDLTSLLRRHYLGFRMALAPLQPTVRISVSPGDLMAMSGALGWQQIVVERCFESALVGSASSFARGETLVVLWPAWRRRHSAAGASCCD